MSHPPSDFESWISTISVQVCIPCLNEAETIQKVVLSFKAELPQAEVLVYDNASDDDTIEQATRAGATVIQSPKRGKGNVVRDIFKRSTADYLILVDGDDTYRAAEVRNMLEHQFRSPLAMIVATRQYVDPEKVVRPSHLWGNRAISRAVSWSFGTSLKDVLSGYRCFPRSLYKRLVLDSKAFDIETEITLQTLSMDVEIIEMESEYRSRPENSFSKLNTWADGILIFKTIWLLVRYYRPLFFFSILASVTTLLGLAAGWLPIQDYLREKFVYHVPLALLAASLIIISLILLTVGIILDSMKYYHNNQMRRVNRLFE